MFEACKYLAASREYHKSPADEISQLRWSRSLNEIWVFQAALLIAAQKLFV